MENLVKSQAELARLSNMKALVMLALADGELAENEISSIAAVAARDNVAIEDVEQMFLNKDNLMFTVPDDNILKTTYLRDLVIMMVADGEVNERELSICRIVAEKYGFSPDIIDVMASDILRSMRVLKE